MSEIIERFEREFPQHKEAAERLRQSGQGSYLLTSLLQLIVDFRADCERLEKEKDQAHTLGLAEGRAECRDEIAQKLMFTSIGKGEHYLLSKIKQYLREATPPQTEGDNHNGRKE